MNAKVIITEPAAAMAKLTKFSLNGHMISDLTPLSGLTVLTKLSGLYAGSRPLVDFSPLSHLPKIIFIKGGFFSRIIESLGRASQ